MSSNYAKQRKQLLLERERLEKLKNQKKQEQWNTKKKSLQQE